MSFNYSTHQPPAAAGILVVKLNGRLMGKNEATELLEEIEEETLDGNNRLIIDLSKLDYMNSSGLSVLVSLLTKARNEGGEVVISSLSPKIEQLFIITKLNTVFSVVEDVKAGIELLNA